jgi:hypothetical protein
MGFGLAVGEVKGALVALGDIVAPEGKAGRVKMREALLNAFLGPDRQSHLATQPITPLGRDCIERPAKLQAIAHRRSDPGTKPPVERFVGKKLGRERQRSLGKPQAIAEHPGHRFARCDLLWRLRNKARVDHT